MFLIFRQFGWLGSGPHVSRAGHARKERRVNVIIKSGGDPRALKLGGSACSQRPHNRLPSQDAQALPEVTGKVPPTSAKPKLPRPSLKPELGRFGFEGRAKLIHIRRGGRYPVCCGTNPSRPDWSRCHSAWFPSLKVTLPLTRAPGLASLYAETDTCPPASGRGAPAGLGAEGAGGSAVPIGEALRPGCD